MPLASELVGQSGPSVTHDIDARWTMAYAAALGDILPCYVDTRQPAGVVAHPLFPVCFEWPLIVGGRQLPGDTRLTPAERMRSVHATHDLVIHRPVRPGDRLTTVPTIVGVERRKPGAYQVVRLDTTDANGAAVCTTWMGALYRGVDVDGPDRPATDAPNTPMMPMTESIATDAPARTEIRVAIAANLAHVYSECARIWNPIHTDRAFAAAAGLPDIILHGTATLALAISRIITTEASGDPTRVRRIAARFGAMVFMPSEIVVRIIARDAGVVRFEVLNSEGRLAVRDGVVVLQGKGEEAC
ncbi:MAG: MaoC family dehydratase N-terminal domain-containing protein [Deltaproteobacteria bacterium]|nr:MaoC family dehydratase N-terminal domain-containing protein [Deltaproteobacteria bacterium]MBI3390626.1 MaoC family dehydratase N-terminal domain-containing protein [Deltaproteobacteria bacterium]